MVLVVIGHPLLHFISLQSGRAIYYWMYLFTMPVFALLSGYVSRNYRGTPKEVQRAVSTLVIPYLLVESAYQLLQRHYTGKPDPYMLLSPKWVAWFLAALFIWRLTTPLWRSLRHPIIVSILISLLVPLTEVPNVFALPKTLGMLPFYVVGMYMTLDRFERLAALRARVASAMFLAAVGVACAVFSRHWDISWTKWRHRYGEAALGAAPLEGLLTRSLLITVGLLMSFAILSLVPWRESWTSRFGERTLYCYLLHGFVVYFVLHETHLFADLRDLGNLGLLITIIGGAVLALTLMTKPVATVFKPLFEADLSWAFTQRERLPK
jgi:fucose 4-O-acetylase-like acetyltransferase